MQAEPQEAEVPSHADRAGTEPLPVLTIEIGRQDDVFQGQSRPLALGDEPKGVPARGAGEFPGQVQRPGRLAAQDRPTRIALDLITAAQPEVAGHRAEPARDALRVGQGVPEVFGIGVVDPAGDHGLGGLAFPLPVGDLAELGSDGVRQHAGSSVSEAYISTNLY